MLLLSALATFTFWQYLFGTEIYLFNDIASDSVSQTYPQLYHIIQSVWQGNIPTWSFQHGAGQGVFLRYLNDPFMLPLFIAGEDDFQNWLAFCEVIKIVLAGCLFRMLLIRIGFSQSIAALGAISFAFSSFLIVGSGWRFTTQAVYLVIGLIACENLLKHGRGGMIAISFALIAVLRVHLVWAFGLILGLYALFRMFELYRTFQWRFFLRMLGWALLGIGISALYSFTFLESAFDSLRNQPLDIYTSEARGNSATDAIISFKLFITTLSRFFSSDLLGNASSFSGQSNWFEAPMVYFGLLGILLLPLSIIGVSKRSKIIHSAIAIFLLICLISPLFRNFFWLYSQDYYRFFSLAPIVGFIYLSCRGLENLADKPRQHLTMCLVVTCVVLISFLFWVNQFDILNFLDDYWYNYEVPQGFVAVDQTIFSYCIALLIIYTALLLFMRRHRFLMPILLCVFSLEMVIFSQYSVKGRASQNAVKDRPSIGKNEFAQRGSYNDFTHEAVELLDNDPAPFYRVQKNFSSNKFDYLGSDNDALAQNYFGLTAYESFLQPNYVRFLVGVKAFDTKRYADFQWRKVPRLNRLVLLKILGVKYLLAKQRTGAIGDYRFQASVGKNEHEISIYQSNSILPIGVVYNKVASEADVLALNHGDLIDRTLLNAAVLSQQDFNKALTKLPSYHSPPVRLGRDEISNSVLDLQRKALLVNSFAEDSISGTLTAKTDGLIVFSIPFDKGWSLRANGKEMPLVRAQFGLLGALVGPGTHSLSLEYAPPHFKLFFLISAFSTLIFLFLVFRKKRAIPVNITSGRT